MVKDSIDCWLVHDFRGNNPVFHQLLGEKKNNTRRCFLFIPADGEPVFIAHHLDKDLFSNLGFMVELYSGWQKLEKILDRRLKPLKRIAMEYSTGGKLPMISWVDGGTIELIKDFGLEIVSSADLFQAVAAVWGEDQYQSHLSACDKVAGIKDDAFKMIKNTVSAGGLISEYEVKRFILERFEKAKMVNTDGPVVAVNENSGNPHYDPSPENHKPIGRENYVLIDLWARRDNESGIFCDITWVGYTGDNPPAKYVEIFNIVKTSRDLVVGRLKKAWDRKEILAGYQLDVIAREHIGSRGYGDNFFHRTGHSLGGGDHPHGLGANLDNFETHDTRSIIAGTGFTVEPGIYLEEFGVRSEINVYMDPVLGPTVTTRAQDMILKLI
jgi:Xaa-Pro aminopeptidase